MPIRDVPLRIVRARYKLLYFVVWLGLGLLLARWIYPLMPEVLKLIAGNLLFIALVIVAVRSFRGATEPVEPPRAWWRMTGTVRSGIVLAVLTSLSALSLLLTLLGWPHSSRLSEVGRVDEAIGVAEYLALAVVYVNSAVRLRRSPDPVVPRRGTLAKPLAGLD